LSRWLLALAALSYLGLAVAQLGVDLRRWLLSPLAIALVAAELAIFGYVFESSRVRGTFGEFPAACPCPKSRSNPRSLNQKKGDSDPPFPKVTLTPLFSARKKMRRAEARRKLRYRNPVRRVYR
jgi:hypothetical protein